MDERVGVSIPFPGVPLQAQLPLLDRLVEAGYRDFSTGELNRVDAITPLALLAGRYDGLTLSAYVVSAFTRGPALLAMTAAALAEIAPGRARFGIGAGSAVIAEKWNGQRFVRPKTRVEETLHFLRAVLSGREPPADPTTFHSDGFRLEIPPDPPPKLALAALGPKMQELAARHADSVVLNFLSPADVSKVREVYLSTDRADDRPPLETIGRVFVACALDRDAAIEKARRMISGYLTVPVYANFQRWLGRGPDLQQMWDHWERGDRRGALAHVPDHIVQDLFIIGDVDDCGAAVQAYLDSGLDNVTVTAIDVGDAASAHVATEFLERLAASL